MRFERLDHWERIASRWRPAFSSHLVNALPVTDPSFQLRELIVHIPIFHCAIRSRAATARWTRSQLCLRESTKRFETLPRLFEGFWPYVAAENLLRAQGDDRVNARGAARREIARQRRNYSQNHQHDSEGVGIGGFDTEEQAAQRAGKNR